MILPFMIDFVSYMDCYGEFSYNSCNCLHINSQYPALHNVLVWKYKWG